jgi:hypothetical protein
MINAGRDVAEVVTAIDPETGKIVAHAINRTQRQIDRLLNARVIDLTHHSAAEALLELHEKASAVADARALDPRTIGGACVPEPDPDAQTAYRRIVRRLSLPCRLMIEDVVIHDALPRRGGDVVRLAFEKLALAMGFMGRG